MLRCFNSPFMCIISYYARVFRSHRDVNSYREGLSLAMQFAHAYIDETENNLAYWYSVDDVDPVIFQTIMIVYLHWVAAVRKGNDFDADELKSFIANGNDVLNVNVFARFTVAYTCYKHRCDERDSSKSFYSNMLTAYLAHCRN